MDPGFGLKVFVVEDHADIRDALVAILEGEGYEVVAAESAEAAMRRVKEERFDLLVTDYCLPVKTGAWLVEEGRKEGVLGSTKVLMITAHPQPHIPEGIFLMRKPLDVDDFVNEVGRILAAERTRVLGKFRTAMEDAPPQPAQDVQAVELVLYISSSSHSSLRALRNVRKLLERYDPSRVRLTVYDLSQKYVPQADEDRIAFTPTLVRRSPQPRAWILGDLENASVLTDLLSLSGVEEKV